MGSLGFYSNVISGIIQALFLSPNALLDTNKWPIDRTEQIIKNEFPVYDFIIIGAGSAGSVLANRLTEISKWNVLLIEAGDDPPIISQIPALALTMLNTDVDYKYLSEQQEHVCHGSIGHKCYYPRGKSLGGTSSINTMLYVRGNKKDYDDWEDAGNRGWNYKSVLPYFMKSENMNDSTMLKRKKYFKYHGIGGNLNVELFNYTHRLHDVVMSAASELGYEINYDINGKEQLGFSKIFSTVKNGVRESAATAFLEPIKDRKNLHVLKNAFVLEILSKNNRANGVVVKLKNGDHKTIKAKNEIIVSAGAFNSPKILLLSGIGPKDHLKQFDIVPKLDLAVGKNFHDHICILISFTWPLESKLSNTYLYQVLQDYLFDKKGLLTSGFDSGAFVDTKNQGDGRPDIQYEFVYIDSALSGGALHTQTRFKSELNKGFKNFIANKNMLLAPVIMLKPKSRGRVMLRSSDPMDSPMIDGQFLSHEEDRLTLLRGIKKLIKLESTKAFIKNNITLSKIDYEPCDVYAFKSDEYWKCIIKHFSVTAYHPCGTVKMGPASDPNSVVDDRLRIHGMKNLRVIDGSIIPTIISGNDNAPIIMIAEKGADMIKEDWKISNSFLY